MPRDLSVRVLHNPSLDYTTIPPRPGPSAPAAADGDPLDLLVTLYCNPRNDDLHMTAYNPRLRTPPTRSNRADLAVSGAKVTQLAGRLRTKWRDKFVRYTGDDAAHAGAGFVLAEAADLAPHADVVRRLSHDLAEEGTYLLTELLAGGTLELRAFRGFLMGVLEDHADLRISFDSQLYLPWPMLALDGCDGGEPMQRFLGFRHQVEQTGCAFRLIPGDEVPTARHPVTTSLNTDETLDGVGRAPEVRVLLEKRTCLTVRTESGAFFDALSGAVLDDDVMYFWCHGEFVDNGTPHPHLVVRLSDGEAIDADDVLRRRQRHEHAADAYFRPFVLLNACHSGQSAATPRLEHLGKALIDLGASGVLGPQIEIPTVFAAEYAYAFLDRFLVGDATAGAITKELARHFAEKYHNPLALTYSLHCGIDHRLRLSA